MPSSMSLIHLVVVLVVIGLALYLVEAYVPMSPPIKTVIRKDCWWGCDLQRT